MSRSRRRSAAGRAAPKECFGFEFETGIRRRAGAPAGVAAGARAGLAYVGSMVRFPWASLAFVVLVGGSLTLVGCKTTASTKEGPVEVCSKAGQTCKLAQGLLGVCSEAPPGSCAQEPCLVCMGQH